MSLVDQAIRHSVADLWLFQPELVLCATILALLLLRACRWTCWIGPCYAAMVGSLLALWTALPPGGLSGAASIARRELFGGQLIVDPMTVYFRCLLLLFVLLFCILVRLTALVDSDRETDFCTLVLGATVGFCLMVSANHLLMVFLAVEMASIPSYVLAGMLKQRRESSEAALKYAVYGAGAAGIMLYGISLIAGVFGTGHFPTIARSLVSETLTPQTVVVLALAGVMVMVGLAFKLSAVPFHFWCPDVFAGAPAEIDAFLSVASKAAALALLVRVAVGLGVDPGKASTMATDPRPAVATVRLATAPMPVATGDAAPNSEASVMAERLPAGATYPLRARCHWWLVHQDVVALPTAAGKPPVLGGASDAGGQATRGPRRLAPHPARMVSQYLVMLLAAIAAITCTFGNLAAYGQTNIKRMLAYSTIAHAGYMMMAVPAALTLAQSHPELAQTAIAALVFYISVYFFMNLGAFAIVAFLRNAAGTETIADYAGLIRVRPVVVVCFAVILISLIGIPPLAGFVGKFFLFAALVEAGGPLMIGLLVIGAVNSVISLVYYLRVVKVMTVAEPPEYGEPVVLGVLPIAYALVVTIPVIGFGLFSSGLHHWAEIAASQLFS